jgi:DNA-binding GntR family transcriptional regulator
MVAAPVLLPVKQLTLSSSVSEELREAITSGRLQPGQQLVEPALSTQLGVSRAPIREALLVLRREGLVTTSAGKRSFVWAPTEADVDEILSLRVMIETLAAEWAMPSLDDADFAHLEQAIARQQRLIDQERFHELVREDQLFHEYVVRRAGHSRMLGAWSELMNQWRVITFRRIAHDPQGVIPTVLADHASIVAVLRAGDLARLDALHRAINARVGEQMKAVLRLSPQPPAAGPSRDR